MSLDDWLTRTNGTPAQRGKKFQPQSGGLKGAYQSQIYKPELPKPEVYVAPKNAKENRVKKYNELYDQANTLRSRIKAEIAKFKPIRIMNHWEVLNRKKPTEGEEIDVMDVPYVFSKDSKPSSEDISRWYQLHSEAENFIAEAKDYVWYKPEPNSLTGDFEVVWKGRTLRNEGLLSEEENNKLVILEQFWDRNPDLMRGDRGYGIWNQSTSRIEPVHLKRKRKWEL